MAFRPSHCCSLVLANWCTAISWILRRTGKASRFITVVGAGSKATDSIDIFGHQRSKRGYWPFAPQMKAGMYTLRPSRPQTLTTPHPHPLSVRRATANCPFRVRCSDFCGYFVESLGDYRSDRNGLCCRPANGGAYGLLLSFVIRSLLLLSSDQGSYAYFINCSDSTVIQKDMARHIQVMHTRVHETTLSPLPPSSIY